MRRELHLSVQGLILPCCTDGLSYTTFFYSGLKLSAPEADINIAASVVITDTGAVTGPKLVQQCVTLPRGRWGCDTYRSR